MRTGGNPHAQLANIDDRLAAIAVTLREAHQYDNLSLVAELEERYDALLDDRNRIAALIPKPREAE